MSTNINKILILWTLCCFIGSGKAPTFDWEALPDPAPTASQPIASGNRPAKPQIPSPSPARIQELQKLERTEMDPESHLKAFKQFLAALIYGDNHSQIELKLKANGSRSNNIFCWLLGNWYWDHLDKPEMLDILEVPPTLKAVRPELPLNILVTYQLASVDLKEDVARLIITRKPILQILYTASDFLKYLKYAPCPELIQNLRVFWEEHLPHDRPTLSEFNMGLVKSAWFVYVMLAYKNELSPIVYKDGLVWPIGRVSGPESSIVSIVMLSEYIHGITCLQIAAGSNPSSKNARYYYCPDSRKVVKSAADVPTDPGVRLSSELDSDVWLRRYGPAFMEPALKHPTVQRIDRRFEEDNGPRLREQAAKQAAQRAPNSWDVPKK